MLVPFGDGQPYDLVVHLGGAWFLRVQCKTAWETKGCLAFNSRSTDHGHGRRSYLGLADVFGVYSPASKGAYLVPVDAAGRYAGRLRLEPTRNNQRKGVRLAADFEIGRWTEKRLRGLVTVA